MAAIVKPLRSVLHKTPDDYGMTELSGKDTPMITRRRFLGATSAALSILAYGCSTPNTETADMTDAPIDADVSEARSIISNSMGNISVPDYVGDPEDANVVLARGFEDFVRLGWVRSGDQANTVRFYLFTGSDPGVLYFRLHRTTPKVDAMGFTTGNR